MASEFTPVSDIKNIVKANRQSFNNGITLPQSYRLQQLRNLRRLIIENKDAIIAAEQADMYKRPRSELEMTAVGFAVNECNNLIKNLKEYMQPTQVKEASKMGNGQIVSCPRGSVLIIGPWNFPFQLVITPLAGAIAAGCTAIVKPSEVAGNVSLLVSKLIPKYLDNDCYKVVTGGVRETSELLTYKHDLIFFTGGPGIGKIIAKAAAKHLTPCVLELGGKNPVIVGDEVDLQKTCAQIVQARYALNCGQVCTAPEYVIISKKRQNALINALKTSILKKFGENRKESKALSRLKNVNHFVRLRKVLEENRKDIVFGGDSDINDLYIEPTIVNNANMDTKIMENEVFGPILTVFPVNSILTDAIPIVQSYPKPLLLRIFSENQEFIDKIVQSTDSGGVSVNTSMSHFVVPGFPFGGSGNSGQGAYHGKYSFLAFSHEKPVLQAKL